MSDYIQSLKTAMLDITRQKQLPAYYKDDILEDFRIIKKYKGKQFVWLLRECGTQIMPLNIGADPLFINYYLGDEEEVFTFFIHEEEPIVRPISHDSAESLVNASPLQLSRYSSKEEIVKDVVSVLQYGLDKRIWGLFDNPNHNTNPVEWPKWIKYFMESGNTVMIEFMRRAIKLLQDKSALKVA